MDEKVILVDEHDRQLGHEEKMKAHTKALLHRAFSIFIFNSKGEMLLQQRAKTKYHSGGLWTNTCCSHPRPHETIKQAAHRRLMEEMGFDVNLKTLFTFIYQVKLDHDLSEHEYDHVLIGTYDGDVAINPSEVEDFKWIGIDSLNEDVQQNPDHYTAWFKIALPKMEDHWR